MLNLDLILPASSLGISRLTDEPGYLTLPFAMNTNDKATMFAGSIFSLAALSGYDTVYEKQAVHGLSGDLFLLSSQITYHTPALSDLVARSHVAEDFVRTRRGNFRMSVRVEIVGTSDGLVCAAFQGTYVVKAGIP